MLITLLLLVLAINGGLYLGTILYSCAKTAKDEREADISVLSKRYI